MNRIEKLIEEMCPEGVETKTLGDLLGTIPRGRRLTKSNLPKDGLIPVFHGGLEPIGFTNEANSPAMTVMVINVGASAGTVGWSENPFWCSDGCFALPHSNMLLPKYLYYCAAANQQFFVHKVRRAGIPTLSPSSVLAYRIPVPPLKIQKEIVNILDKFTQLEAELEAELEAREKQYEEVRRRLLDFESDPSNHPLGEMIREMCPLGVESSTFGEVAVISRGASPRPIQKFISDGPNALPWIKIGDVRRNTKFVLSTKEKISPEGAQKSKEVLPGDFLLSNSMSFGRPYISKIRGYIHDGWLAISDFQSRLDPDFLYHQLSSQYVQSQFEKKASSGTVRNLNAEIVKSVKISLPPLEIQKEIVRILDSLDSLVNSVNEGIPAEIAARRKQYEYYRDKLLTFKELDAA